jgi:multisubunit Na+/H+ antiporter MnhE subunit
VRVIVAAGRPRGRVPATGFIRVPVAPMTPQGTALLACLVSLTPGTSVIEIDGEAHTLVLHMLDLAAAEATVEGIRRDFEPALVPWFGTVRP